MQNDYIQCNEFVRKIELEQIIDNRDYWKWRILEWDGRNWVTVKYGLEEGFDKAVKIAKEQYKVLYGREPE